METKTKDASPSEEEASTIHLSEVSKDTSSTSKIETNYFDWRSRMITDEQPPEEDILYRMGDTSIIAKGNYTVITGKKKSRKSLLAAYLISKTSGKVLIFDTEQAHRHVWEFREKVVKLKKTKEDVIVVYLRGFTIKEKKTCIINAIKDNPDVSVVMIDNIRDLLTDINNSKHAQQVIQFLEKITNDYNVGMLVTIHSNKSDGKIRGHIGSELENKAFMVIHAERKSNVTSAITCESSRDGDFEPFTIRHHPLTGMPEILNEALSEQQKKERFHEILDGGELGYKELLEKVRERFGDKEEPLPEGKAKNLIRLATDKEWITKIGKDRSPNARYAKPISDTGINSDLSENPSTAA